MKKVILGILIGLSLSTISVVAISLCNAKDIEYKASDTKWDVDTVEDALNDLYKNNGNEFTSEICKLLESYTFEYSYIGKVQEFTAFCAGKYKIELWGARGGSALLDDRLTNSYAYGAYTAGNIHLEAGTKFYIYVGGAGNNGRHGVSTGGWNGGGNGSSDDTDDSGTEAGGAGGGATDIRFVDGEWNNFDSLKSRIMVAGGGGGGSFNYAVGPAGGLIAPTLFGATIGGSQTSGYAFGYGQAGIGVAAGDGVGGGGGGYYGGTARNANGQSSGAGGSSFISGHEGCDAILKESTQGNIKHSGQANHYSNYIFTDTIMVDGQGYKWTTVQGNYTGMPTFDGKSNMSGNNNNGYAKITYLGQ